MINLDDVNRCGTCGGPKARVLAADGVGEVLVCDCTDAELYGEAAAAAETTCNIELADYLSR